MKVTNRKQAEEKRKAEAKAAKEREERLREDGDGSGEEEGDGDGGEDGSREGRSGGDNGDNDEERNTNTTGLSDTDKMEQEEIWGAMKTLKKDIEIRDGKETPALDQIMVGDYDDATDEVKELWIYIGTILYGGVFREYGSALAKGQIRSVGNMTDRVDISDEALCFTILAVKMEEMVEDWNLDAKEKKKRGRKKRRREDDSAGTSPAGGARKVRPASTELVQREREYREYYKKISAARKNELTLNWYDGLMEATQERNSRVGAEVGHASSASDTNSGAAVTAAAADTDSDMSDETSLFFMSEYKPRIVGV